VSTIEPVYERTVIEFKRTVTSPRQACGLRAGIGFLKISFSSIFLKLELKTNESETPAHQTAALVFLFRYSKCPRWLTAKAAPG